MKKLLFEKVSDVNSVHPYLCVYFDGDREAFMEINVDQVGAIKFVFYPHDLSLGLSMESLVLINERANDFARRVMEDSELM